jgi:hypothetical protein
MTDTLTTTPKETAKTIIKHFAEKAKCKKCGINYLIIPSGVQPYINKEVKKFLNLKTDWLFENANNQNALVCDECCDVRKN